MEKEIIKDANGNSIEVSYMYMLDDNGNKVKLYIMPDGTFEVRP